MNRSAGALALVREVLAGSDCWLVGGAIRDELLGQPPGTDLDLVIAGDAERAARALARAVPAAVFALSKEFGAWRVVTRGDGGGWQLDLASLRGASIEADLGLRDFTINAIARPLAGGALVDPFGGAADLAAGRLRIVASDALEVDPLRALRLVRFACELGLDADERAMEAARLASPGLRTVATERIYAELQRILGSPRPADGMRLALALGCCTVVLPELEALRGVEQSRYHHLDVLDHTLLTLDRLVELELDPAPAFGDEHDDELRRLLAAPLADEMTHAEVLRFGALLHDIAKPLTRTEAPGGHVRFPGHDVAGAELARAILARLHAAERVRAQVAALTLTHLRLGFLVHEAPLSRRALYGYLDACDRVAADVTVLSVADRLATAGAGAEQAIARHLELARAVIGETVRWQLDGRPPPLVRGDQLARALGLEPGPIVGHLLAGIAEEAFAGSVTSGEEAIAFAASQLA